MKLATRIALFLDPTLVAPTTLLAETAEPLRLDFGVAHEADMAHALERIAKSLERLEKHRRRPRIVECQHPELHEATA
jgi:hypothetical protein